eukprot:Rhum_TRINITY_DN22815_c0_g1::Rhum_TRINITY_DN22815_c0_g1_i1::g.176145::m.176145
MSFNDLPQDSLRNILSFTGCPRTLVAMGAVNTRIAYLADDDSAWEALCRRDLPREDYAAHETELRHGQDWCGWKTVYSMRSQTKVMRKVVQFVKTTVAAPSFQRVDTTPLSTLINLDLSKTCIGKEGAVKLGAALKGNYVLEKLDLSNQLMGDGVARLADVVLSMRRLVYVNLSGNRLGPDGAHSVRRLVSANRLRRLDVADNHFGAEGCRTIASASVPARAPASLALVVDKNGSGNDGFEALLGLAPRLVSLSVRDNRITSDGARAAVAFLEAAPASFEFLDLSNAAALPEAAQGASAGGAAPGASSSSSSGFAKQQAAKAAARHNTVKPAVHAALLAACSRGGGGVDDSGG